jgi:hypothetical protein
MTATSGGRPPVAASDSLRVVGVAPREDQLGRLDVGAGLGERVEHLAHPHAVAATEQVPVRDAAPAATER